MFDLPNKDIENERMLIEPAGCCCDTKAWLGKRAFGRLWTNEFLDACIAAGSIVEPHGERSAGASWARVLTVIGFLAACVMAATYNLWMPR